MNGNVLTFNDKIVEGARWIVMVTNKVFFFIVKRLFDIICALIGLVFLIPVAIIVKIAYMLTGDFSSIFFTQNRIGKNGKEFKFYKFRTMYPNADQTLKQLLEENEDLREEYAKNKKLENDPRITKMGKILRATSLDELPQVINVDCCQCYCGA